MSSLHAQQSTYHLNKCVPKWEENVCLKVLEVEAQTVMVMEIVTKAIEHTFILIQSSSYLRKQG